MKPFHLLSLWAAVFGFFAQTDQTSAQSGNYLISHEWMTDIPGLLGGQSVKVFKIVYNTVNPFGELAIASGAFAVPRNWDCAFPLVSYQHGTILNKNDVPSNFGSEGFFSAILSALHIQKF